MAVCSIAEMVRLEEDAQRALPWKRWGPYLAERQWSTVREDYSPNGDSWGYFPHEAARSRAYRWGEDGLLGICDRQCRLCFSIALWNGNDPFLKERLFGLTGPEGNHGEDVKEQYFYLDSTPTHSYLKALYKYPQSAFPYAQLVDGNRQRGRGERELELEDLGVFDDGRYFDVQVEYAKASPCDLAILVTLTNRAEEAATLHVLPTLWFRNTWSWGRTGEGYWRKPSMRRDGASSALADHASLGAMRFEIDPNGAGNPRLLFTENETNVARLFGGKNASPYVKDAFHEYVVGQRKDAVNPAQTGTKLAVHHRLHLGAGESVTLRMRLTDDVSQSAAPFASFDETLRERRKDADDFYLAKIPGALDDKSREVSRQAYAGLLWSKQFFHYVVKDWIDGDPASPPPPQQRLEGRNHDWEHVHCRDVISMPDKWEYPWFAAWDLAFHAVPFARIDPAFAKDQLLLFLREWYMHPNGQVPAYEFAFGDVNPPVHAWAAWRVYKIAAERGQRDHAFLSRVFQKLLINFTWWVNRKDAEGNNLFGGGFLGLDNVGVFDRSKPLPVGGHLAQADGTAWMAFYCVTMLSMALELSLGDPAYEDMASKFFEHFVAITDSMNSLGGNGLWDEADGFYYDQLVFDEGPGRARATMPLRLRSMVGIIPLFAAGIIEESAFEQLPGFAKRTRWFLDNRKDLARHISYMVPHDHSDGHRHAHRLLAIPSRERLQRVLAYVLDEQEFLSPYGVRSLSRAHHDKPYVVRVGDEEFRVAYVPGESDSGMFGGNSNWRGPIWMPVNHLLIEALERYHHFYGDDFRIECPTGSGNRMTLSEVARELDARLARIFLPDASGARPCDGGDPRFARDPAFRDLIRFHEYFDGDTGRGCGASHQTGWTALVVRTMEHLARGK